MFRKTIYAALAALFLALGLSGCGGGTNSFTWRVDTLPSNLDPQLASAGSDVTACLNLYSGLFRLDANGDVQPDACESYEVSPNGLTYTFHLKSGLTYNGYRGAANSTPVTAQDFAFGLRRVFLPETGSPYTEALGGIAGSAQALQGDSSALGVKAADDNTLIITLSQKDDDFLRKLCLPGAMPCNQAFFESTGGAYALSSKMTMGNGPFYLYNWTESGLFLRRKASGSLVDAVRIVLQADETSTDKPLTAPQQVQNEKADAALYDGGEDTGLPSIRYAGTTWCLLFNTQNTLLSSRSLRQALAQTAYSADLEAAEGTQTATGLIPPAVTVGQKSYREQAGSALPASQSAQALYQTALSELGTSSVRGITVLLPENSPVADAFASLNQLWQSQLGLYCNVQQLPMEDLLTAQSKGDYAIMLLPLTADENTPHTLLRRFGSGELCEWTSAEFSARTAALSPVQAGYVRDCAALERELLAEAVAVPLFFQQSQLLISPSVQDLVFDPFAATVDLTWATKS